MAITFKPSLYRGTRITKAFSNIDRSGETVFCHIAGVTGSSLNDIANAAVGSVSTSDSFLSLVSADAYRFTDDKAFVVIRFGRDTSVNPALNGTTNVSESSGYEFNDYSTGSYTFTYTPPYGGSTSTVVRYYYKSEAGPVGRLHMHTVLSTVPDVDSLLGKTNNAAYTLGGRSHPANTLRFDGVNVSPIATRTGSTGTAAVARFAVTYNFSRSSGLNGTAGWAKVKWRNGYVFGTTPTGNLYFPYHISYVSEVYTVDRYDRATFSFPVHA